MLKYFMHLSISLSVYRRMREKFGEGLLKIRLECRCSGQEGIQHSELSSGTKRKGRHVQDCYCHSRCQR